MVRLLEEGSYQELRPMMAKCSLNPPGFLAIDSISALFRSVPFFPLEPGERLSDVGGLVAVGRGEGDHGGTMSGSAVPG
jgi:hypothetical protein